MTSSRENDIPQLPIGRLAVLTLAAGVAVIVVGGAIALALAKPAPVAALIVALVTLVGAVAAMAVVANRIVKRVGDEEEARRAAVRQARQKRDEQ